MRVIAVSTLRQFWKENPDAEQPLKAWFAEVQSADWVNPNDLKTQFRSASILKNSRVVFNIAGNKYRLVTVVLFETRAVLIKFIGDHRAYNSIDANTVDQTRRV